MAKILIGLTVYRIPQIVINALDSVVESPVDIVVVDNDAEKAVKSVLQNYGTRIHVIRNETNLYCNGGWNQILGYGLQRDYDLIGFGSAHFHPGWYETICKRFAEYPNEVWLPEIGEPAPSQNYHRATHVAATSAGFFTFMPRAAVEKFYPIPSTLRQWFGDTYMYNRLESQGWRVMVLNDMRAYHQWSRVKDSNPIMPQVVEEDKREWEAGRWFERSLGKL